MKTRYDKLIGVRRAENRIAAAAFAAANADLGAQQALAYRLQTALDSLSLSNGPTSAAEMAARMELASRMAAAQNAASTRIETAQAVRCDAGIARQTARHALDTVREIRRVAINDAVRRHEAKRVPVKAQDPFQ